MNGGLLKSASQLAIIAATGLFVGGVAMPSAKAADLGGDCCADLEERVAELEATTARKGNRRMSLTITGQVHRGVLWWDDGKKSDTYYGLDNTNSSSRFSFLGEAKVTGAIKMGFEIMIEVEAGGTSSKVSQFDEDGKVGTQINGAAAASFNASNVDAYAGDARRVAWWIEHKDFGRMTVGRYEGAGVVNTIDLGGISAAASSSVVLINGSFLIRGTGGEYAAINWAALGDPASSQGRTELVRYDSPTIAGFIFSASVAETGDYWGTMLRYAGEFSGFRIAAGIGYERVSRPADERLSDRLRFHGSGHLRLRSERRRWPGRLGGCEANSRRLGCCLGLCCTSRPACSSRATTWRPTSALLVPAAIGDRALPARRTPTSG